MSEYRTRIGKVAYSTCWRVEKKHTWWIFTWWDMVDFFLISYEPEESHRKAAKLVKYLSENDQ